MALPFQKIKRNVEIFFINILGLVGKIFIFSRNLDKQLESFIVTLQARENGNEILVKLMAYFDK